LGEREVELSDGEHLQVELRMEPERTLSALVVDGSGRPVADVYVRALPLEENGPIHDARGGFADVQTGADGRVTLRGLTEAAYGVRILKFGYTLDTGCSTGGTAGKDGDMLRVGADTAEVRLVLEREPHIIARVVGPDGAPVRRFEANKRPMEDANGAFAIPRELADDCLRIEPAGLAPMMRGLPPVQGSADLDLGVLRMPEQKS
jgi:hypothetical protein